MECRWRWVYLAGPVPCSSPLKTWLFPMGAGARFNFAALRVIATTSKTVLNGTLFFIHQVQAG